MQKILVLIAISLSFVASINPFPKCNLRALGEALKNDKVIVHHYDLLYCAELMPFIYNIADRPIRMLEIGFGCGHHNHGTSALMWHKFFKSMGGKLDLWEVDYKDEKGNHAKCVKNFMEKHSPQGDIVKNVYLGDQGNQTFMKEVVAASGGKYDIVIDDGGHVGHQIRNSFEVLWPHVVEGGVYIIEDLGMNPSRQMADSFVRDIDGWVDQLVGLNFGFTDKKDVTWTKWPSDVPPKLLQINCRTEICSLHKDGPR